MNLMISPLTGRGFSRSILFHKNLLMEERRLPFTLRSVIRLSSWCWLPSISSIFRFARSLVLVSSRACSRSSSGSHSGHTPVWLHGDYASLFLQLYRDSPRKERLMLSSQGEFSPHLDPLLVVHLANAEWNIEGNIGMRYILDTKFETPRIVDALSDEYLSVTDLAERIGAV